MSGRRLNLWTQRLSVNLLRSTVRLTVIGCAGFGCFVGVTALHCAMEVNGSRKRYWSDGYFLTPESLRMPYEEHEFTTEDGITLTGWIINNTKHGRPSKRVIVLFHPYNMHMSSLLAVARSLYENRFTLFLVSFRSFAKVKTRQSIGYLELRDARAGIKFIKEKIPDARIGVCGASLGATTAIRVAPEFPDIVAVCADCPFARLKNAVTLRVASVFYILPITIVHMIVAVADKLNILLYNYSFDEVSAVDSVSDPRFTFPFLLIHCEQDVICPISEGQKIFESAVHTETKQIWRVPDAQHLETAYLAPREYAKRVVAFFDDCYDNVESGVECNAKTSARSAATELTEGKSSDESDSSGWFSYFNPVQYYYGTNPSDED